MSSDIETIVKTAIANQKMIDADSITLETSLQDLGVTSLDAITIVYEVEEICDIEVPNDELENLRTVQDIVNGVRILLDNKTAV
ncbi:acyl carrier protein [Sedimenticola selenatireducens]|jgi:acyl carrier protein|uniref:Acyl carrier protein n=1 Tax=Sedimenticola selenatireducens TaxID=191960 RepID=A0A557SJU5_9GAMM|nr:acyl carrier protein [Sedimenticola selenatireducens]TVO77630.1 acyl carrier protein [Sedimenticola selenatireducens]TVT64936.1 MAG: acyl carrier protein [Sedimenticola selenatireducens]